MPVSNPQNVNTLLSLLIDAETATQRFYLQLMESFAHEPLAAQVWWKMGADEAAHIRLIEQAQKSLSLEQLQSPADPIWLEKARAAARFSPDKAMAHIQTLEDAYQEAHAIENSELNAVFEFVMTEFFPRRLQQDFVRSMLREHLQRLDELRTPEWRRSISAQKLS